MKNLVIYYGVFTRKNTLLNCYESLVTFTENNILVANLLPNEKIIKIILFNRWKDLTPEVDVTVIWCLTLSAEWSQGAENERDEGPPVLLVSDDTHIWCRNYLLYYCMSLI